MLQGNFSSRATPWPKEQFLFHLKRELNIFQDKIHIQKSFET